VPFLALTQRALAPERHALTRRRACSALLLLIAWTTALSAFHSHAQLSREFQLKAVFLFNFAQFTEWPTNAFTNSQSPVVIGVLGNDPFGTVLEDTIRGETVHGRKLTVTRFQRIEDIGDCHILYIAAPENRRPERVVEALGTKPILTVSDMGTAAGSGVMIRFVQENNRLRIRINLDAVTQSGLTVSSKLLRASEVFTSGRPQ
jgi:hypothetical protein